MEGFRIEALNAQNLQDRLMLCWGHIDNWRQKPIVKKCAEWLNNANTLFAPTTFVAYEHELPIGMIEFLPQGLLKRAGLCPCRANPEAGETERRYDLGADYDDYLFISCLYVDKDRQGKGVGKALLSHLLGSDAFRNSDGAFVYVAERDESWDKHIHWPAGSKKFYTDHGFTVKKELSKPAGWLLTYEKKALR